MPLIPLKSYTMFTGTLSLCPDQALRKGTHTLIHIYLISAQKYICKKYS